MYLGLDLGTSGLRALLVDEGGTPVASAVSAYAPTHPRPGWSEQDPEDWVQAVDAALGELAAAHPGEMAAVAGIGVSGHMHGATLLDADGTVLRPCILWNDTRSAAEAAELDALERVRALSGNIVFPGFTAPKLVWVARHEPEIFARIASVLLPAAYLNFHLTGEQFADMSDSAGTSWLDVGARAWSPRLLEVSGMCAVQMPRLVEGCEVGGALRPDLAHRWGMTRTVQVVGGAGDNAASACGVGALRDGAGFVSLGTSGVVLTGRDGYAPLPESAVHTFCHAVPGQWYQMGVILSATDSLNWLSRITGTTPAALSQEVGDVLDGPGRVRFLPYLSGERTPHNDSRVRGGFLNLDVGTDNRDMTRAVMEGVAFALRDCAEALRASGARLDHLLAVGGGTRSRAWVEMIATLLGVPLGLPDKGDFGAALGAARLAMVGCGAGSVNEVMTPPPLRETVEPNVALSAAYDEAYAAWRAAYPAIRDLR
ncbi:xylulokinase [Maliponia aquimaris]|uniref:Xylulose kinase n=1 Tax=Maliponia aquimaris TaxID=1673631 RepID=A0A238K9T1_9RHOB|nr:xylulokinase [Maliponia aquimaris]SMX39144.1 Xylulose kinase [Maliponia aquimaris]